MSRKLMEIIKKLPQKPGIYIFFAKDESASGGKDVSGRIIYIGKAIDLKKRVRSHFSKKSSFYGAPFADKIADIDWIRTKNESEAMLLEDQLIKKYKPRYNIQWKDDKSYFWVTYNNDEWPRVQVVHKTGLSLRDCRKADEAIPSDNSCHLLATGLPRRSPLRGFSPRNDAVIGPFVNGRELKKTLRALRKIFPFRTCKNAYDKPCLQWHLGLCVAHNPNSKFKIQKYLNLLNALGQFLRLYAGEPIRIEAYDISNIQGKYATGSMIVFYGDKPQKSDYRKFRIKTVRGVNDTAMIREVLKRRLLHKEWPSPDLILIDGGRAQLAAALFQVSSFRFQIPVIALAKREEEIYTEYSQKALNLKKLPESLRLVFKHFRDEAHRFAIFYYRYLHGKKEFSRPGKTRNRSPKTP